MTYATLAYPPGSGNNVVGPGSATDNAIARFDGTTGKLIQNSGLTINDSNRLEMGFNEVYQPTITGGRLGSQLDGNAQSLVNLSFIGSLTTGNLELLASGGVGTFLKLNYLDGVGMERAAIAIQTGVTTPVVSFGADAAVTVDMENNPVIGLEALTGSPDGNLALTSSNNHSITLVPNGIGNIVLGAFTGLAKLASGVLSAATAGTDYVTASSTNTFTNKTYDTAGTGNSFSINGVAATDNTGTGKVVRDTSPTLVTPTLGVASATTINKVTLTTPATGSTLTIPDGVTLTGPAASGTAMTLGNTETVTGVKTFGSAGAVGRFKLAGTTSGTTTLDATAVASGTLTLPAATDTLVGKATTDALTNKDLTSGTNTFPTFNQNTSGTASNLSGTPTLPNGTLATTQALADKSTKLATTAYADRNAFSASAICMRDDFTTGSSSSITTAVSAALGELLWATAQISGGTQTTAGTTGSFNNPGQLLVTTSATSGQGLSIYRGSAAKAPYGALGSNAGWEANFCVKIGSTSTICMRVGFCVEGTQVSDAPTNGMYVEYDTANTGNTDSKFTWVTRSSSVSTYGITNAVAADTSFHNFRIRSTAAGTILFSVDGGTEYSTASTVPTGNMMLFIQTITRTSGAATQTIDFVSYIAPTGRV